MKFVSLWRWLLAGIVMLVLAIIWQFVVQRQQTIYFNKQGQIVPQKSDAFFVRHFYRQNNDALVQDFYLSPRMPYSNKYHVPLNRVKKFLPVLKNGNLVLNYINGKTKSRIYFSHSQPDGSWSYWHPNGQRAASISFHHGIPVGEIWRWYDNGEKQDQLILNDHGERTYWRQWYDNGQLKMEMSLSHNAIKTITAWDKEGNLTMDVTVKNNLINGVMLTWFPHSIKKSERIYHEGNLIQITQWDEDGNIVESDEN